MAKLTSDQIEFLRKHEIPADRVYDASGKRNTVYQAEMKAREAWVAFGVTPCKAAGHTLRSRKGHCIQCVPANLSYLKRFDEPGEVYLAQSISGKVVKVGTSIDAVERVRQLNGYNYGGRNDWQLLYRRKVEKAGRVECNAHQRLASYHASGSYFKNGGFIDSKEIFFCTPKQAISALNNAL